MRRACRTASSACSPTRACARAWASARARTARGTAAWRRCSTGWKRCSAPRRAGERDVSAADRKPEAPLAKEWWRLKRSLRRRWREWRLPRGYRRLGTRYGGWWLYGPAGGADPRLVDCGVGRDISFPVAFLERFGGRVIGVDPNPAAIEYCNAHRPSGMEV